MKILKKMLVINWHYFSHDVIPFDRINFLTGRNAAGKSTLIDAMQLVLLGETNNYFFNKAANEKSARTLDGYLRGEIGDDGGTGVRCLRTGDFNTYVVLEFQDDVKDTYFTAGIVFDVYGEGHKHKFFMYDGPIPENGFMETDPAKKDLPLGIDQLRRFLKKEYGNRFEMPDTNMNYRSRLLAKMGALRPKFFSLLKKAVPFTPITDIETFITEYMCEVKGEIDMSYMRENLRSYKRLEQDAQTIGDRISRLEAISAVHGESMAQKNRVQIQQYLVDQSASDIAKERLDGLNKNLLVAEERLQELTKSRIAMKERIEALQKERDKLFVERAESDVQKKLDDLEKEIITLNEQMAEKVSRLRSAVTILRSYGDNWAASRKNMDDLTVGKDVDAGVDLDKATDLLQQLSAENVASLDAKLVDKVMSGLEAWGERVKGIIEDARARKYALEQEVLSCGNEKRSLEASLSDLKKGIKPYPKAVAVLKKLLAEAGTEAIVLADALEVRDPKWQRAIEGYLHTQKFNLLVAPEHFEKALSLYDKHKREMGIHGVGLVDAEKVMAAAGGLAAGRVDPERVDVGSLAEEVTSENPWAKAYANHLLGKVIKCEDVLELRRHHTAITPSGMLYKNFVASQMNPERFETPFIGRKSIEAQIALLEERLVDVRKQETLLDEEKRDLAVVLGLKVYSDNECIDLKEKLSGLVAIGTIQDTLQQKEALRKGLDLTYIMKLSSEIEGLEKEIRFSDEALSQVDRESGQVEESARSLKEREIPSQMAVQNRLIRVLETNYEAAWIESTGFPRYQQERTSKSIQVIYENFERSTKGEQTKYDQKRKELQELRMDYNRLFHMTHETHAEDNGDFDRALEELRGNKLPLYLKEITDAKEKTYDQFRDEFLAKLKDNFDRIKQQLKELNDAIKASNFGNDQYRYKVEPKPEYRHFYDMITDDLLMTEGMNLSSFAFREKHGDAIDELFRMIIDVENADSADVRTELEKNIKRFTDYRSYLNFDLVVTDQEGREQRLSKTLLKKSGGETQTPFYISVLASFAHLYRVHQPGNLNQTARLIIFDEAFSKMDSQRIKESLQLLRRFGLQAIISAPPDKIPDITPYVDTNLCVIRDNDISFVKTFSKGEGM